LSPTVEYNHPALNAGSILEERNHLAFMSRAKTELISAEQRRALGEIIRFASAQSSWWRGRLKEATDAFDSGAEIDQIVSCLPVTTRRDLQDDFSRFGISIPGATKADYKTISTSGSTGRMVQVEKYLPEMIRYSSAHSLFEVNLHKRKDTHDLMVISFKDGEKDKEPAQKPLSLVGWRGLSATRSAVERSNGELLDEVEQGRFGYIFSNANQIRLMAMEQLRNPRKVKVKEIQSWVDGVDPELRELVKRSFGCRIIDRYSSEEFGPIAMQCPKHDHLHLIAPYLYMEVVDEQGNPVPEGELGRIQLTSLTNRAFPLFRYQLGDLVIAGPPCKQVNWPTIEKVVGRVRDYISGPNGEQTLPRIAGLSIRTSPNFLDSRIYLFQDKAVLLAAVAQPMSADEIRKAHEELEYAFYLEPGMSEIVISQEGKWRDLWKRKSFEKVDEPYSEKRMLEIASS
jgi:phenylacetate-CoA ligase